MTSRLGLRMFRWALLGPDIYSIREFTLSNGFACRVQYMSLSEVERCLKDIQQYMKLVIVLLHKIL